MYPRIALEKDLIKVKKLWEYCFDDSDSFNNYYFNNRYCSQNTVVIPQANSEKLLAALQLNQYQLSFKGLIIPVSYIIGISTLPEQRGSGLMKKLLCYTLQEIYNRNQSFAIIMAIDSRLYKKYQFSFISDMSTYHLKTENCRSEKNEFNLEKADQSHCHDLALLYNRAHRQHGLFLNRDSDYFRELLAELASENLHLYLVKNNNSGHYTGYLIYSLTESSMIIREWCYLNKPTLYRMLNYIYQHNMQVENVEITAAEDDYIKHIVPINKKTDIRMLPFMMGRIINVERFFDSYKTNAKQDFTILINDRYLLQNNGTFHIKPEGNKLVAKKTNKKCQAECDIATLTQLACGYLSVSQACQMDILKIYDKKVLTALNEVFVGVVNYINEFI